MKITSENPNKGTITTTLVMDRNREITSVSYDQDGDWQFFSDDDFDEDQAMVVSLQQILDHDKTLLQLPDIEKGTTFFRKDIHSDWTKEES